jgi:hypothetical protein
LCVGFVSDIEDVDDGIILLTDDDDVSFDTEKRSSFVDGHCS